MKTRFACTIFLLLLAGPALAADAPAPPPDFAAQFKEGDTNHDGKLSFEEYKAARLIRDGGKVDETKLKHYAERFAALDVNKDNFLTLEEYQGRIANAKYQPADKVVPAAR